jgi:hypothetical protein
VLFGAQTMHTFKEKNDSEIVLFKTFLKKRGLSFTKEKQPRKQGHCLQNAQSTRRVPVNQENVSGAGIFILRAHNEKQAPRAYLL